MSSDFPTPPDVGEENVRQWQRRMQPDDEHLPYTQRFNQRYEIVRVSMREDK